MNHKLDNANECFHSFSIVKKKVTRKHIKDGTSELGLALNIMHFCIGWAGHRSSKVTSNFFKRKLTRDPCVLVVGWHLSGGLDCLAPFSPFQFKQFLYKDLCIQQLRYSNVLCSNRSILLFFTCEITTAMVAILFLFNLLTPPLFDALFYESESSGSQPIHRKMFPQGPQLQKPFFAIKISQPKFSLWTPSLFSYYIWLLLIHELPQHRKR